MAGRGEPPAPLYARHVRKISPPEPIAVPPCIVCESTASETAFRVEGVEAPLVVCTGCRLGRYHPMPSVETIASFYPPEYYGEPGVKFRPGIEALVRLVATRQARWLTRGLSPDAEILDVGCGRGVLVRLLAELGFRAHGFEVNAEAVSRIDPRVEVAVAPDLLDAGYAAESFDEVILWHVLEHLRNPKETLAECRRILRPDGRIVVAVPNFASAQARFSGAGWFHLDPPRHLYHFPVDALCRLLERSGFTCRSTHHFSLRQNPFGWIQSAMNRSSRWPRNALYEAMYRTRAKGGEARRMEPGLLGFLLAAAPLALSLSVIMAVLRQGATVHVIADRSV